jgi:large subunit ribosomal protein L9
MKVVLLQDVPKLGHKHAIIQVKAGYARNYLLPEGLASIATPALMKQVELRKQKDEALRAKIAEEAKQIAQKLKDQKLTLSKKTAAKGSLYAAISTAEVAALIERELGIKLDPSMVIFPETIKKEGEYKVEVKLSEEITGHFKLSVKS